MNLLCRMFGHQPLTKSGWCGGVGYAKIVAAPVDGVGCVHYYLNAACPRCGLEYPICNVHELGRK